MGDSMKSDKKYIWIVRVLMFLLTISLIVFIFSNSAQSADVSSETSGRFMAFLNNILAFFRINAAFNQVIVRTCAHFAEFGLLGVFAFLTSVSFFGLRFKNWLLSSVFCVLIALVDECIQLFSDGRAFQFSDLLVDFTGSVIGISCTYVIVYFIIKSRVKSKEKGIK